MPENTTDLRRWRYEGKHWKSRAEQATDSRPFTVLVAILLGAIGGGLLLAGAVAGLYFFGGR